MNDCEKLYHNSGVCVRLVSGQLISIPVLTLFDWSGVFPSYVPLRTRPPADVCPVLDCDCFFV